MARLTLWQAVAIASQLGFVMGTTVVVGLLGGWLLDDWLHTRPVLTLLGSLLGLAAGTYSVAQLARSILLDGSKGPKSKGT